MEIQGKMEGREGAGAARVQLSFLDLICGAREGVLCHPAALKGLRMTVGPLRGCRCMENRCLWVDLLGGGLPRTKEAAGLVLCITSCFRRASQSPQPQNTRSHPQQDLTA